MDAKDSIYRIHMHSRNHCCAFVGSRASIFPADISPWLGGAVARLDMTGRAAVLDGRIIPVYAARVHVASLVAGRRQKHETGRRTGTNKW
jgi:hypothetical protein